MLSYQLQNDLKMKKNPRLRHRYARYLVAAAELARSRWTQFNEVTMLGGLLVLGAAVILNGALIWRLAHTQEPSPSYTPESPKHPLTATPHEGPSEAFPRGACPGAPTSGDFHLLGSLPEEAGRAVAGRSSLEGTSGTSKIVAAARTSPGQLPGDGAAADTGAAAAAVAQHAGRYRSPPGEPSGRPAVAPGLALAAAGFSGRWWPGALPAAVLAAVVGHAASLFSVHFILAEGSAICWILGALSVALLASMLRWAPAAVKSKSEPPGLLERNKGERQEQEDPGRIWVLGAGLGLIFLIWGLAVYGLVPRSIHDAMHRLVAPTCRKWSPYMA